MADFDRGLWEDHFIFDINPDCSVEGMGQGQESK